MIISFRIVRVRVRVMTMICLLMFRNVHRNAYNMDERDDDLPVVNVKCSKKPKMGKH